MTGVTPLPCNVAGTSKFQSSPVGDDGCDTGVLVGSGIGIWFQSSPVGDDGCDTYLVINDQKIKAVSILTRRG